MGVLALALLPLAPVTPAHAEETPLPASSVSPSPDPTTTVGATATTLAGLSAPVRDIAEAPVRDIVLTLESRDGTETQKDTTTERTLILDSKVLFAEDRATLSGAARRRLKAVAEQTTSSSATGPRVPNADTSGRPIPANQAKNRRVEITFTPGG